ncbi:chlorophyllase [Rhodococcus sp. WMMA185]|uniref:alpha/beta hydrolase family protein n=1 Tax=Rhodococcus sp. WMMA185 TaxID=679318 RepID=UPI000878F537|nr:chlorophyllase [Rhodococcus sp. WMMA185]AOW91745.1 chlorophyllase [Rhodococcus sp. WMMA185]
MSTSTATASADTMTPPVPVMSFSPVVFSVPGRPADLQLRVTAPQTGTDLPVILFSHGHGPSNNLSSLNGYAPLVNFWAASGFVVIQPTHLSSRTLSHLIADTPGAPFFWRSRNEDMIHILDRLDGIEEAVPLIAGRINHTKVAVAGHSFGGFTSSLLLGARVTDPDNGEEVRFIEPRIKAGVLLAATGRGDVINGPMGDSLPFLRTIDFSTLTKPALVVAGDADDSRHFTDMGPDWHADPYTLGPSPKSLLTLFGAEHSLGGIPGYDVVESTDESPERVAAIGWLTSAYLRSELHPGDNAWQTAREALAASFDPVGRVEGK